MLTIWGPADRFCDGISRRGFLRIGALGSALTLAGLLKARSLAGTATRPRSAILIYLFGGPSHIDTYDLKPDAPEEFRGEYKPIATNVPGVQIGELFPMQARMWDKLAVIRSVVSSEPHGDTFVMTGYTEAENRMLPHPSFGSVVSKVRGSSANGMPTFINLREKTQGTEPGFLGIAHRAFTPSGPGSKNLQLTGGVSLDRLNDRKALLGSFDTLRRDIDSSGTLQGMDSFNASAIELIASGAVRNALDLSREDAAVRERYKGVEQFLTARRLVEAGAGCVTLTVGGNWDAHEGIFKRTPTQAPLLDRGIANLIQDLHDRGLQDDVVTLCWGEFGRTPRVNKGAGRDHWPEVMSALIAGGGLKMGQAIGSSTARGERPKDRPYTVQQVLSTGYQVLGIDPARTFPDGSGRPIHILDQREPVVELL